MLGYCRVWVMVRVEEIRVPDSVRVRELHNFGLFNVVPLPPPPSPYRNHGTSNVVSKRSLSFADSVLMRSAMLVRRPLLWL